MKWKAISLAAAVGLLAVGAAPADSTTSHGTVNLTYLGYRSSGALWHPRSLKVDTNRDGAWDWDHTTVAGQYPFQWDEDATGLDAEATTSFQANPTAPVILGYCIDVAQHAGRKTGPETFEVIEPDHMKIAGSDLGGAAERYLSADAADRLRELFARYHDDVDTADEAGRFAVCVWEIVYEDLDDYGTGGGYVRANDAGADAWLSSLDGSPGNDIYALLNEDYQDMAVPVFGVTPVGSTPEPVTLLAVTLGLGGLGGYLRRRRARRAGN
jgi:hypothetical protein